MISYLQGRQHSELTEFRIRPVRIDSQDVKGAAKPLARPADLDWWVRAGTGSLAWPIEDGPYSLVVMNADGTPAVDADVTIGLEVDGAFRTCLIVAVAGLVLVGLGLLVLLRRGRPARALPVGVALLVLTGCAALPERNSTDTLTRPAVSEQAANDLLAHYDKTGNTAALKQDDKLLTTIEAGPQSCRQPGLEPDPEGAQGEVPAVYVRRATARPARVRLVPDVVRGDRRAVHRSPDLGPRPVRAEIGRRHLAQDLQRLAAAGGVLPDFTGITQYSTTVEQGLSVRPKNAAANLVGYLNVGARSPLAKGFALDANTIAMLRERSQTITSNHQAAWSGTVRNTFSLTGAAPPVALLDGSALVFVSVHENNRIWCAPGSDLSWTGDSEPGAFDRRMYGTWIESTTQHQFAMVVPARQQGGPIKLLGINSQVVGASGR